MNDGLAAGKPVFWTENGMYRGFYEEFFIFFQKPI